MRAKSGYSLQRTMIIYFLLIGFACMLVSIEFLSDFHSHELKAEIWESINQVNHGQISRDAVFAPIDRLRSKAILMVGIIIVVMVIVLTMFIKNITEPLQHMIEVSQKISTGDLSQTIQIQAKNELAELGNMINEMSSNLQEIILLSQGMCESSEKLVSDALARLQRTTLTKDDTDHLLITVKELKAELAMLNEIMTYFSFYSVD